MDKVKILVVEDEIIIADDICDILDELGYEVDLPVISYSQAVEVLDNNPPDLIIIDIQLAGRRDGIDLAWTVKDKYQIPFIFLTSNADAATVDRAKKVNPPAYLLKPFNKNDLFTTIEIALYNHAQSEQETKTLKEESSTGLLLKDAFFVKHKQTFQKIMLADILFLKSDHVYINIFTKDGKVHLIRSSLSSLLERLPDYFFKIQRSYVINLNAIDNIGLIYVNIGKHELPFGKGYRAELLKLLHVE